MFSTPAGLSNMGSQGIQNLVIHWKKITRSPQGNPRSPKTPPNTSSGLAPLIWSILAPSHAFLALPGCLKWTILPPKKTYWEKSFRELQGTPGMSKTTQNTLSEWATLILCILTHFPLPKVIFHPQKISTEPMLFFTPHPLQTYHILTRCSTHQFSSVQFSSLFFTFSMIHTKNYFNERLWWW